MFGIRDWIFLFVSILLICFEILEMNSWLFIKVKLFSFGVIVVSGVCLSVLGLMCNICLLVICVDIINFLELNLIVFGIFKFLVIILCGLFLGFMC